MDQPRKPPKMTRRIRPQTGPLPMPRVQAQPTPRTPDFQRVRVVEIHLRHLELGVRMNSVNQGESEFMDHLYQRWLALGAYIERELPLL